MAFMRVQPLLYVASSSWMDRRTVMEVRLKVETVDASLAKPICRISVR